MFRGAVAADGRVEPGDMLLQVNDVNFENMSNDDAVHVLRDIVHKPGPITLTVAKCWDPNPNYFTIPKYEPVQPIDPATWVNHTRAVTGDGFYGPSHAGSTNLTETSSDTMASSLPESERYDHLPLSIHSEMAMVVKSLQNPNSGLDIKTRMWLKITIPDAFIGSDLIEWLSQRVEGLQDRRDARLYATNLLKGGYIRHTVNKTKFSEQCYYVFGDYNGTQIQKDLGNLSLGDSNSDHGSDMLGPLPSSGGSWTNVHAGHPYPTFNNMQFSNPYHPGPPDGAPKAPSIQGDYPTAANHPPPPLYGGSDVDTLSIRSGSTYSGMPLGPGPYNNVPHNHRLSGESGSDRASSRHSGRSGSRRDSPGGVDRLSDKGSDRAGYAPGLQSQVSDPGFRQMHAGTPTMSQPHLQQQLPIANFPPPPLMGPRHPGQAMGPPQGFPPHSVHSHPRMGLAQHQYHNSGTLPYGSTTGVQNPRLPLPPRSLSAVPPEMSGSRRSFQQAMGNPCEFFVDVM